MKLSLSQVTSLDTICHMKEALLRYQTLLVLGFHLLSIFLALFFLRLEASIEDILELVVVVAVAHVLAQSIRLTVTPLIRYYRSLGHFAVIHRLGALSSILIFDVVIIAALLIWTMSRLRSQELSLITSLSYLVILIIPSLTRLLQLYLEPEASDDLKTMALIRRLSSFLVIGFLLFLLMNDMDVLLIAPVLAIMQVVLLMMVITIRFQYVKELTYRRQYEDSGHQESFVQLGKMLSLQALSLLPMILVQFVAIMLLYLIPHLLIMVDQSVPTTIFQSLMVIVITASIVRLLFHWITPSPAVLYEAEASNNQSRLRNEVTLWIERGALVEGVVVIVVMALLGVIVPMVIEMDYRSMILSVIVGYFLGIHAYLAHMIRRFSIIVSSMISLTAILLLIGGSVYYAVYFGYIGMVLSALITLLYLYIIAYVWAFKEYEMEGKPHLMQLLKIFGMVVLSGSIVVVLGIVLPPLLDPLATGLRVIAVSSILLLVEVVIIYTYLRVTGLTQYLLDKEQFKQQFDTIYLALQEEETIW